MNQLICVCCKCVELEDYIQKERGTCDECESGFKNVAQENVAQRLNCKCKTINQTKEMSVACHQE